MRNVILAMATYAAAMLPYRGEAQVYPGNPEGLELIKQSLPSFCQQAALDHVGNTVKLSSTGKASLAGLIKKFADIGITLGAEKTRETSTGVLPADIAGAIKASGDCRNNVLTVLAPYILHPTPQNDSVTRCDDLAASPLDVTKPDDVPGVALDRIVPIPAIAACREAVKVRPVKRMFYQLGRALESRPDEAAGWYTTAADQGHAAAAYNLGLFYFRGTGVPQDGNKAVEYFTKAARLGFSRANVTLGRFFFYGTAPIWQSDENALPFLQAAAEAGDRECEGLLADLYYYGRAVPQSYDVAFRLYRKAAAQGDGYSWFALGWAAEKGEGVPKSTSTAVGYYRKGAERGEAKAQEALRRLNVQQ